MGIRGRSFVIPNCTVYQYPELIILVSVPSGRPPKSSVDWYVPWPGCALSSSSELWVARRPVRSRQGKARRRVAPAGRCPVYRRFLRYHRPGFLRGKLDRLRTRHGVRMDLDLLLDEMMSTGPYKFGRPLRGSYNTPQESTCSGIPKRVVCTKY